MFIPAPASIPLLSLPPAIRRWRLQTRHGWIAPLSRDFRPRTGNSPLTLRMNAFHSILQQQPVAHAILVLAIVAVIGLLIGSIRYRSLSLGTAGVLFAGIAAGHFGIQIEESIRDFVKEFGLILFVFTIGLQLGPGFFASLRREGLRLNLLAAAIVLGGAVVALVAAWLGLDPFASLGLFSGATTNTPSLGAAQQTLATLPGVTPDQRAMPALAYAVAYPVGIVGIITSLLLLRILFRIDVPREVAEFETQQRHGIEPLIRRTLVVTNPNLDGLAPTALPGLRETGVVISRIQSRDGIVRPANPAARVQVGDLLLAVGTRSGLDAVQRVIGHETDADLMLAQGPVTHRRVVVTLRTVLGRSLAELGLEHLYGVIVSRVSRADLEMTAVPDLRLQFGDVLNIVGEASSLERASEALGNSARALHHTRFTPFFVGIALGVLAGLIPVAVPGLPVPVRLGLAGGPLIVAILLSRLGHFSGLVWHIPAAASVAFRELGITLFLACVGLKAGEHFVPTVLTPAGASWIGIAALLTLVPLLIVGVFARVVFKLNYMTLCGLLSGSMTDPPALAFAGALARSDAPNVAYATVYPLTMLLRIVTAQLLALILAGRL